MIDPALLIKFSVKVGGSVEQIQTYRNSYRNLMMLIKDKFYPDSFGECGGMGRCGTCLVRTQTLRLVNEQRNESSTLSKLKLNDEYIRLSCQLLIDEALNGEAFEVLDPQ